MRIKQLHQMYVTVLLCMVMAACATSAITQADSPEQRVILAYKTYQAAHEVNAYLVTQKLVTPMQAQVVYNDLELARQHLDAAQKLVRAGDNALGNTQLQLAETTLQIANEFLKTQQAKRVPNAK